MHKNSLLIKETTAFIQSVEYEERFKNIRRMVDLIKKIIDHEAKNGIGDYCEQLEWFLCLSEASKNTAPENGRAGRCIALNWAMHTANPLGISYLMGVQHKEESQRRRSKWRIKAMATKKQKPNIEPAVRVRRLIGAASRERVRAQATTRKHLSKERAAAEISDAVGLSTGTIKRYLSELFPGDNWKKL